MGFTRNYKNLLMSNLGAPYRRSSTEYNNIPEVWDNTTFQTLKSIDGVIQKLPSICGNGYDASNNKFEASSQPNISIGTLYYLHNYPYVGVGVIFGTNDAEESIDDYTISQITTLSFVNPPTITSSSYDGDTGKLIINYSVVVNNPTDVTINEFGIGKQTRYYYSYSSQSSDYIKVLLYRKKLDTPIELKANEPQLVSFSIAINYPTDDMLNGISTQLDEIIDGGE